MKSKSFLVFCSLIATLIAFSVNCGGGASVGNPDDLLGESATLSGELGGDLSKPGKRFSGNVASVTFELTSLTGQVLRTYSSTTGSYVFEGVSIGKAYIIKATTALGNVYEMLTETVEGNMEGLAVDLSSTVSLALLRRDFADLNSVVDLDAKRQDVLSNVQNAIENSSTWYTTLVGGLTSQTLDEDYWSNFAETVDIDSDLGTGSQEKNYVLSGNVFDNSGLPIANAKIYLESDIDVVTNSSGDGTYSLKGIQEGEKIVSFEKEGFSKQSITITVGENSALNPDFRRFLGKGQFGPSGEEALDGSLSSVLIPNTSVSLEENAQVTLGKPGSALHMRFKGKGGQAFAVVRNKSGKPVWRSKYANATLDFSVLDPSSESDMAAMPGELKAVDEKADEELATSLSKPRLAGEEASDEVGLKSVSMVDLSLRGSSGEKIDLENGDYLDSYMRLPEADQKKYFEQYESGDRMIPLYSYDETQSTWIREGEAQLIRMGDIMYGRAAITHFSWWNLDQPSERGRLEGYVYGDLNQQNPVSGAKVTLQVIGDNYSKTAITDDKGYYSMMILRDSEVVLSASVGGASSDEVSMTFGNQSESQPYQQDFIVAIKTLKGQILSQSDVPLDGALLRAPDGTGVYSDENGNYEMEIAASRSYDLLAQYTVDDTSFLSEATLDEIELAVDEPKKDIVIDLNNFFVIRGQVTQDGVPVEGASVYTAKGGTIVNTDGLGNYEIPISRSVLGEDDEETESYLVPLRVFYYNLLEKAYPSKDLDVSVEVDVDEVIQNIAFSSGSSVALVGTVLLDDEPVDGAVVLSSAGQATRTNAEGEYRLKAFDGQIVTVTAKVKDSSGIDLKASRDVTVISGVANSNAEAGFGLETTVETFNFSDSAATVYGKIFLEEQPLAGVEVKSPISKSVAVTDGEGAYELKVNPRKRKTNIRVLYRGKVVNGSQLSNGKSGEKLDNLQSLERREYNLDLSLSDIESPAPVIEQIDVSSWRVAKGGNIIISVTASDLSDDGVVASEKLAMFVGRAQVGDEGNLFGKITELSSEITVEGHKKETFLYQVKNDIKLDEGEDFRWINLFAQAVDKPKNSTFRRLAIKVYEALPENRLPTLLGLSVPTTVSKNAEFEARLSAWDQDGDELFYDFTITNADGTPVGSEISTEKVRSKFSYQKGKVRGKTVNIQGEESQYNFFTENARKFKLKDSEIGNTYLLTVTVSDNQFNSTDQRLVEQATAEITVINKSPQIERFFPKTDILLYGAKKSTRFEVTASDPEGESLSYLWEVASSSTSDVDVSTLDYAEISTTNIVSLRTRNYLSSSNKTQYLFLRLTINDESGGSVVKQKRFSVLPRGSSLKKQPVALRIVPAGDLDALVSNVLDEEGGLVESSLSFGKAYPFSIELDYNTGDVEDVTSTISMLGDSVETVRLYRETLNGFVKGFVQPVKGGTHELSFVYNSNGTELVANWIVESSPPGFSAVQIIDALTEWIMVAGTKIKLGLMAIFEPIPSEDEDGNIIFLENNKDVTTSENTNFLSSNPSVAEFSDEVPGELAARNVGTTTMTLTHFDEATGDLRSTEETLEVVPISPVRISHTPNPIEMVVGDDPVDLKNYVHYNDGSVRLYPWEARFYLVSEDRNIAIVNGSRDIVAVGAGSTNINVSFSQEGVELTDVIEINVTMPEPEVVRLEVFPEDLEFYPGDSQDVTVTAIYNTGLRELLNEPDHMMSGNSIAVITSSEDANYMGKLGSSNLLMKATRQGETLVEFSYGEVSITSRINVVPAPDEASLEEMAKLGGAVYESEIIEREFGSGNADILVYNQGRRLVSVDTTNPEDRNTLDTVRMNQWISGFELSERFIHVVNWTGGYRMITFDNPANLEMPDGYGGSIEGYAVDVKTARINNARYAFILSNKRWSWPGRVGIGGIAVLDITNPLNVVRVGKISLSGWMRSMEIIDNHLYVTSSEGYDYDRATRRWVRSGVSGLQVVDVSNPVSPELVSTKNLGGYTWGLDLKGDNLYIGARNRGWWSSRYSQVFRMDISERNNPQVLSSSRVPAYWVSGFNAVEDGLFMAMGSSGVGFAASGNIDGSFDFVQSWAPTSPNWVTEESEEDSLGGDRWSYVSDVKVHKGYAYISNGHNGMSVYKVEDNKLTEEIEGYPNISYVTDVLRVDDFALVSSGYGGILSFDAEDQSSPTVADIFQTDNYSIFGLEYDEDTRTVFASAYKRSYYWWWGYWGQTDSDPYVIFSLRLDENGSLTEISRQSVSGSAFDMTFVDGSLYIASNDFRYSWSNASRGRGEVIRYLWDGDVLSVDHRWTAPQEASGYSYYYNRSRVYSLAVQQGHVYASTRNGLYILDDNLEQVGYHGTGTNYYYGNRVIPVGDRYLLLPNYYGLQALAIKSPTELIDLDVSEYRGYTNDVSVQGRYAIVGGWENLKILDLSEMGSSLTGFNDNLESDGPSSIESNDSTGNLGGGIKELAVIDTDGWIQALDWSGDLAVTASGWEGVGFYRVTLPVSDNNVAPIILGETLEIDLGESVTTTVFVDDGDEDDVTLSVNVLPESGEIDLDGETLTFTPDSSSRGEVMFTLSASDGELESYATFTVFVNAPPELTVLNDDPLVIKPNSNGQIQIASSDEIINPDVTFENDFFDFEPVLSDENYMADVFVGDVMSGNYTIEFSHEYGLESKRVSANIQIKVNDTPYVDAGNSLVDQLASSNVQMLPQVSDREGDLLTYLWTQISGPEVSFSDNTVLSPDVTLGANAGNAMLELTVSDPYWMTSDNLSILTVSEPQVQIDDAFVVGSNTTVVLGSRLMIEYPTAVSVLWSQASGPSVTLNDADGDAWFIAPSVAGDVIFNYAITYEGGMLSGDVTVTVNATPQIVTLFGDEVINLSATGNLVFEVDIVDQEGDDLTYLWTPTSQFGSELVDLPLSSNTELQPLVINPDLAGEFYYQLTVSDGYSSASANLNVWINTAPVADAGQDKTVELNSLVTMDATGSVDVDDDLLTYTWAQVSGVNVVLGGSSERPTFTAPSSPAILNFQLIATDDYADSIAHVTITVGSIISGNILEIDSGATHTLMKTSMGQMFAVGSNDNGQLGDGTVSSTNVLNMIVAGNVRSIAAGSYYSLVNYDDGSVDGVGINNFGQLGDGTTVTKPSLEEIFSGNIIDVSAGAAHSLFLDDDGSVWASGYNNFGQLGSGNNFDVISPIAVASSCNAISAGRNHSLILKNDGSVWATGYNGFGQLGDQTIASSNTFLNVIGGNVIAISAGETFSLALKEDGSVMASGIYQGGDPDYGTSGNSVFVELSGLSNVVAVEAGGEHSLLLDSSGNVHVLGYNENGQLGLGDLDDRELPVSHSANITAIGVGYQSSFFVRSGNILLGSGDNGSGQLGLGDAVDRNITTEIDWDGN